MQAEVGDPPEVIRTERQTRLARPDRLRQGGRTPRLADDDECVRLPGVPEQAVRGLGAPRVRDGQIVTHLPIEDRRVGAVCAREAERVVVRLERRHRDLEKSRRLVGGQHAPRDTGRYELDPRPELEARTSTRVRTLRDALQERNRAITLTQPLQRTAETALELQAPLVVRPEERRRALEEVRGGRMVEGEQCPLACTAEPRRCLPRARDAELDARGIERRSFQVDADELVALAALVEPTRERLVQRSPLRPSNRLVGGAADERMDELVVRPPRPDEPVPLERGEVAGKLGGLRVRRQRAE